MGTRPRPWPFLLVVLVVSVLSPETPAAACTDADGDGFFFEEDCGTVPDCNDASADTYPGAQELCNGIDDDCSNGIDDALACERVCDMPDARGPMQISPTDDRTVLNPPSLAWNGSGYGAAWIDRHAPRSYLYFARFDRAGQVLGTPRLITGGTNHPNLVDMVWTGAEYGLVWLDDRDGEDGIFFARLDADGSKIGEDRRVSPDGVNAGFARLVWTGHQYGVVWQGYETMLEVYFARLDGTGVPVGDARVVSPEDGYASGSPVIVWSGSEYGVFWSDSRAQSGTYFLRLDPDGQSLGSDVWVTDMRIVTDAIADGAGYGLCAATDSDGDSDLEAWFLRTTGMGTLQGALRLSADGEIVYRARSVAWSGEEYGLSWIGSSTEEPPGFAIRFARVASDGARAGSTLVVGTNAGNLINDPVAVWTGEEYGIVAATQPAGTSSGYDLFFYRVGCGCVDADSDGVTDCFDCDDSRDFVYPGAPQLCNGVNDDCNDPEWPAVPVAEFDGDDDGYSPCEGDCDDGLAAIHPGAEEPCNGVDDDCDGWIDEDANGEDTDGDGVHNACDDCPLAFDPLQGDGDEDGAGDACDNCVGASNPDQADGDRDRVGDACDNCPVTKNLSQSDVDQDSIGDHCDADDGTIYVAFPTAAAIEWQEETGFDVWNCYRGDLAELLTMGLYTQEPGSNVLAQRACGVSTTSMTDSDPPPGQIAFFLVSGMFTGATEESTLGTDSAGVIRPNQHPCD